MKILAIETSCDETGIAILEQKEGEKAITLLGNALASQIELHAQYGGVFPAMAKRAHAEKIVPLTKEALKEGGLLKPVPSTIGTDARDQIIAICTKEEVMADALVKFFNAYEKPNIDYIAVTVGPGLEPALWVGINFAKALSTVWDIPIIPVNHMEGHVVTAAVIQEEISKTEQQHDFRVSGDYPKGGRTKDRENHVVVSSEMPESQKASQKHYQFRELQFPLLALLVSGGHTELVLTKSYGEYEKIGQTRDDAVGEAFDKVARMIGLPYPGGPAVSKLAKQYRELVVATDGAKPLSQFDLPRPMLHSGDYDFSFSGIKTAVLYTIRDLGREMTDEDKLALAAAFEDAVVEVLIKKTIRAIEEFHIQTVVVGGGVAGNAYLRECLTLSIQQKVPGAVVLFPEPWLATDNAVMIGLAALARVQNGSMHTQSALLLKANGNLSITE